MSRINSSLPVPEEIKSVLEQSLEQQWLLPNSTVLLSCEGAAQSYKDLEGYQAVIKADFGSGEEEAHVFFDEVTKKVKGFYTSSLLVSVDSYEEDKDSNKVTFQTNIFYLSRDEPTFVGREEVSIEDKSGICSQHFRILTAHHKGMYYGLGNKMKAVLRKEPYGCLEVVETPGSKQNILRVIDQDLGYHFALAQADAVSDYFEHHQKTSVLAGKDELRVVLGLYREYVQFVCKENVVKDVNGDGEKTFSDIFGQTPPIKVNIPTLASGMPVTFDFLVETYRDMKRGNRGVSEIANEELVRLVYYPVDYELEAMDNGHIDCSFFVMGVGGEAVREALEIRDGTKLISFSDDYMDALDKKIVAERKLFYQTEPDKEFLYKIEGKETNQKINTLSMKVLLVTRKGVNDKLVCHVSEEISKWLFDKNNFSQTNSNDNALNSILKDIKSEDLIETQTRVPFYTCTQ